MNEPIVLDVDISEQYDMDVAGNDGYEVNTDSKIVINKINTEVYDGEYEVTPQAHKEQILLTKNKSMTDNVTVLRVPYFETSNIYGNTVFIATEVK